MIKFVATIVLLFIHWLLSLVYSKPGLFFYYAHSKNPNRRDLAIAAVLSILDSIRVSPKASDIDIKNSYPLGLRDELITVIVTLPAPYDPDQSNGYNEMAARAKYRLLDFYTDELPPQVFETADFPYVAARYHGCIHLEGSIVARAFSKGLMSSLHPRHTILGKSLPTG